MAAVVQIGSIEVGAGRPLALIAGPCVIEDRDVVLRIATGLAERAAAAGVPLVFKASFDKANRTSVDSFRGPGLDAGLEILAEVRREVGVPVTTDVHTPQQATAVAQVADLLQIPAFLCRQTDLLVACGATGKPVNIKKGQFVAPWDMAHAVDKARRGGATGVILTERGTTFGYNNLVVDMRAIAEMAALGTPVCIDATHSVQLPGAGGASSGGERHHAALIARAALAAGAHLVFAEVHENPSVALSDAATQLPLSEVSGLLSSWKRVHAAVA
jgi:2-dehydro-3-deoxyphosphooctonate aldolase (KDO 8-P synthase)